MTSCYTTWKTAKTGERIPCFSDGKPSASLYNPQREALQFTQLVSDGYTVIVGLAAGLHILEIAKSFPKNKIIVVEKDRDTINFLLSEKSIKLPLNIILCEVSELENVLLNSYFPPIDGNFSLVPLRSWVDANPSIFENVKEIVQKTLETLSADISTQAHFGKLWQHNIIQNLQLCENIHCSQLVDISKTIFPTKKKAFIAGAGPSLDEHYNNLQNNRDEYFIIATDTAYHSLRMQNIFCDVVISVDAQFISHSHFVGEKDIRTLFLFDLCANPIATKTVIQNKNTVAFFKSNHPLCNQIESWYVNNNKSSYFPNITSSGGTVTMAALHFAEAAGFNSISTGGCDFAYIRGKMYTTGTYLDSIFNSQTTRLSTIDNCNSKLMFRTELSDAKNGKTTTILKTYKKHYDNFFLNFQCNTQDNACDTLLLGYKNSVFPASDFLKEYFNSLGKNIEYSLGSENSIFITLYPYISWYAQKHGGRVKKSEIHKIAQELTIHFA